MLRGSLRYVRASGAKFALIAVITAFTAIDYLGAKEMNSRAIDINEQGPNGQHMIFWSIQGLNFDEVEAYLDAGVDIEVRGFRDATPVIWAAASNSWDMVLFLARRGADLSASDRDGMSVCTIQDGLPTRPETENGRALQEVRGILRERGLCKIMETSS